jgi:rubrerythrin
MSHPRAPTDMGTNRTGIQTSPFDSKDLIAAANTAVASPLLEPPDFRMAHEEMNNQAPPVGSMPPPATMKGMAEAVKAALKGDKANVLLDKLGERLAFERSGTRLYEAFLTKLAASDSPDPTLTREAVQAIHDDELRHFGITKRALEKLGGDPTVMTTSADIAGVASMGLVQVLTDSRTTVTQCLEALLIAELTDNDAWSTLVRLVEGLGMDELAAELAECEDQEEIHLAQVRRWYETAIAGQAGLELVESDSEITETAAPH